MTANQEAFNIVATHLLAQNAQAKTDLGSGCPGCVYLDPNTGHRCAVGILIPADKYTSVMEGKSPGDIQRYHGLFTDVSEALLDDLQSVHDDYHPDQWKEQLYGVAKGYHLRTNF
ncbi:hypothetical protein NKJ88_05915 [Mesorhizobium sp. M0016]|uniref:hypothetical protein n=1 Tax=Mesorhizobium sp. M0016 TaxID=2956843 RepID=UPI00333D2E79